MIRGANLKLLTLMKIDLVGLDVNVSISTELLVHLALVEAHEALRKKMVTMVVIQGASTL